MGTLRAVDELLENLALQFDFFGTFPPLGENGCFQVLGSGIHSQLHPVPVSVKCIFMMEAATGSVEKCDSVASLMWASRWSLFKVTPGSGQVKSTPGTAGWGEISSLGSGTKLVLGAPRLLL